MHSLLGHAPCRLFSCPFGATAPITAVKAAASAAALSCGRIDNAKE